MTRENGRTVSAHTPGSGAHSRMGGAGLMSKRTTKGGRNGRNEPARVDTTLSAKLDVLDQLEMRFGRDFSEATSMLKEFRKELLDEAAKAVVKGTSDVVGSDEWFIAGPYDPTIRGRIDAAIAKARGR